jgi:hypothetical protein
MFTVLGSVNGVAYRLDVGATRDEHAGSPAALATLQGAEGQTVLATPTGPAYELNLDDPASVLAALMALTDVVSVGDGAPAILPAVDPTVVY